MWHARARHQKKNQLLLPEVVHHLGYGKEEKSSSHILLSEVHGLTAPFKEKIHSFSARAHKLERYNFPPGTQTSCRKYQMCGRRLHLMAR